MMAKKNHFVFIVVCCCLLTISFFISSPAAATSTSTVEITGSTPLTAYNITVNGVDSNHAMVTWNTNGDANSTVQYGTTTGYGSVSTDAAMGTTHTINLAGVSPGISYHYRVVSINIAGESYASADATFTTSAATVTTDFAGTTIEVVGGVQQVNLNQTSIQSVQGTVQQTAADTVTVQNPGNGWSQIQYIGSDITSQNGNISIGQIQEVIMQSDPVTAALGGNIGTVSAQIDVGLTQLVTGASVQQDIVQTPTATVTDAFQIAATNSNLNVQAVAYTVEFHNTALLNSKLSSDAVKLTLSVSHTWVSQYNDGTNNEGRGAVIIIRYPESGPSEVLTTRFVRYDSATDLDWFEADSPHGLSIFGLITAAAQKASQQAQAASQNPYTASSAGGGAGGGGGGGAAQRPLQTAPPETIVAERGSLVLDRQGITVRSIDIRSLDNLALLSIPAGVKVTDTAGQPVGEISIAVAPSDSIEGALAKETDTRFSFEGLAYNCGPDGARFDPPITLTFTLTEDRLAKIEREGREPTIRYYDTAEAKWISVVTTVNRGERTVTASVSHFTVYGLFSEPSIKQEEPHATQEEPHATIQPLKEPVIFTGMFSWLLGIMLENPIVIVIVIAIIAVVLCVRWWKRRL